MGLSFQQEGGFSLDFGKSFLMVRKSQAIQAHQQHQIQEFIKSFYTFPHRFQALPGSTWSRWSQTVTSQVSNSFRSPSLFAFLSKTEFLNFEFYFFLCSIQLNVRLLGWDLKTGAFEKLYKWFHTRLAPIPWVEWVPETWRGLVSNSVMGPSARMLSCFLAPVVASSIMIHRDAVHGKVSLSPSSVLGSFYKVPSGVILVLVSYRYSG